MIRFRIGIDLGTTNCALAAVAVDDPLGHAVVLNIPQAETDHSRGAWPTLPSFLCLPPGNEKTNTWQAGRWARARSAEMPGRVVHSAKSWLGHHATDRRARFLPLGTTDLAPQEQISPVQALSILLRTLAHAWDSAHPDAPLARQEIAVTVPASFDPVAQQLTLEAARDAGFPETTVLLEEPQAAFYAWIETQRDTSAGNPQGGFIPGLVTGQTAHVLVADLGGGTTDFSLFAMDASSDAAPPHLRRIAVSDHILLGGDNLDLALAHAAEDRLTSGGELPATAFAQLLARCREIKEEALSWEEDHGSGSSSASMAEGVHAPRITNNHRASKPTDQRSWSIAVARPGASLLAGTLRADVVAEEVTELLLEGFFPAVGRDERPQRAAGGLREMGLPYAKDPAITRHLADFLRGRPTVDFLLCNGGLTKSPAIRARLLENIARWQQGNAPRLLENTDPDLAVARGAARFLHLKASGDASRIEAGAAHSYYVGLDEGRLLCVLARGAASENPQSADAAGLRALVGRPVVFPLFRHARRPDDRAGDVLQREGEGFTELPSIETLLAPPKKSAAPKDPRIRVRTTLRATGLLRVELFSAEPSLAWNEPWPLEFSLRGQRPNAAPPSPVSATPARITHAGNAPSPSLADAAAKAMVRRLKQGTQGREKLSANAVFSSAEKSVAALRSTWSAGMVRSVFDSWMQSAELRKTSTEHEDAWLHVAGYLLRPGVGLPGDEQRIQAVWPILGNAPHSSRNSTKVQRWICARRIAAGLGPREALALWQQADKEWPSGEPPTAEIALLAGALEMLPLPLRVDLARRMAAAILQRPNEGAFWKSLGRLLSRALFHAGSDQIIPPGVVVEAWETLRQTSLSEPATLDATQAWLRAARRIGLRALDVPAAYGRQIDDQLRRWGVTDARRLPLREVIPLVVADQSALLGEGFPPGLSLLALHG